MSQIPAQLVSRAANGNMQSLDPEYPINKSPINAGLGGVIVNETNAVGVKTLTDTMVLRATSPNS